MAAVYPFSYRTACPSNKEHICKDPGRFYFIVSFELGYFEDGLTGIVLNTVFSYQEDPP
jgi:hypothetical protein